EPALPAELDMEVESSRSTGNVVTTPSVGWATHPISFNCATPLTDPVTFADPKWPGPVGFVISNRATAPAPEPATTARFFALSKAIPATPLPTEKELLMAVRSALKQARVPASL